jgi:aspartate racemase
VKTIGLIGGMSWESTATYYRYLNELTRQRLGGLHSARIVLVSVDFDDIERLQRSARWEEAGAYLAAAARSVELAGADCIVLCSNTMHRVADAIEKATSIPLLHIVDGTAAAILHAGIGRVGLLGTQFTMEQEFYRDRLESQHGITVLVPERPDRALVHRVIYEELCLGIVREESRSAYRDVIGRLAEHGAEAIVLACTEIAMLVSASDSPLAVFDTTHIHASCALEYALRDH